MNPYFWIAAGVVGVGLVVGAFFYGERVDNLAWEAKIAAQKVEAANLKLKLDAETAAKEQANEKRVRGLEARHIEDLRAIDAGRADFDDRLREARRRSRCDKPLPSAPTNPGVVANDAAGSDLRLRTDDPGRNLREAVLRLQADFKTCFDALHGH